jgi:hypothetical protein
VITGAVLLPNTTDLKGTQYTAETIKMAMDGFNAHPAHGLEHKGKPVSSGLSHLASWQLPQDTAFDGNNLPAGTWMMSVLVTDPKLWAKVESGELNGFSIQGTALVSDTPSAVAEAVRLLMLEAAKYRFSSVQANVDYAMTNRITEFGRSLIPDDDLVDVTSRENEPHVTVLYGLHTANPDKVRDLLEGEPGFVCELGKTRVFEGGDSDVVYIEVFADELVTLNHKLATLAHTNTYPTYTPHLTLAYVKKGSGEKYAGRADLEGTCFAVGDLTFSNRNGTRDWFSLRYTEEMKQYRNSGYAMPSPY